MLEAGNQFKRQNPLFGKKGVVLNLGHLDFDIVSNFVLRISYFASQGISTLVESALQIQPFLCKTNPIFKKSSERNRFNNRGI